MYRKISFNLFLAFFFIIAEVSISQAASCTYFVDYDHAQASDSNAGTTEAAPWKTIQHAVGHSGTASAVAPGATLCVKERATDQAYSGGNEVNISGASGQYITLKAYPGQSPRIEYQQNTTFCIAADMDIAYLIIDGLECTKADFAGMEDYDVAGFAFYGQNTSNIILRNNYFHDIGVTRPDAPNPAIIFGGSARHDQVLIEENIFENIGGEGVYVGSASSANQSLITTNFVIQQNSFTNIAEEAVDIKPNVLGAQILHNNMSFVGQSYAGIRLDGQGVEFAYNTMRNSGCSGQMFGASYCEGGSYAIAFADGNYDDHYIHHNYFFDTEKTGGWADAHIKLVSESVTNPFRIEHNTFIGAEKYGLFLNEETGAHVVKNNLFVTSAGKHIKKHNAVTVLVDNNAFDSSDFDVTDSNALVDTLANLKVHLADGSLAADSPLIGAASDGTNIGAWQGEEGTPCLVPLYQLLLLN